MKRVFREPLLWFVLCGGALFAVERWHAGSTADADAIVLSPAQVAQLETLWQAQLGAPPSAAQRDAIVAEWLREETFYREALRLGLDRDDTIVRRRLVQKLEFLSEDSADADAPDDQALLSYYQTHPEQFREPPRASLRQLYFRSDATAVDRIKAAEQALRDGAAWQTLGDPFMLNSIYAERTQNEIGVDFGAAFAEAVFTMAAGEWQGPITSSLGVHLVFVDVRLPSTLRPFTEVREQVLQIVRAQHREQAKQRYYESLQRRYPVQRDGQGS